MARQRERCTCKSIFCLRKPFQLSHAHILLMLAEHDLARYFQEDIVFLSFTSSESDDESGLVGVASSLK